MAAEAGYPLLCLENPLLDIQAAGDDALLQKYGLKANDAILAEEKHMGLFEDLAQNPKAVRIAGGAAQNTARGAQYILPPNSVAYIGCIGKDENGKLLGDICKEAGVHTEYRVDEEQPTGVCGVVITGHNRSLCTNLAAANNYQIEHLKQPHIWDLVKKAQVYFVGGFHLTVCVPAILALAEEAAANNKPFVLSFSAPFIPQFFKEQLDQVVPYCDFIISNESEAFSYAQNHGWDLTDVAAIAEKLAAEPKVNTKRPRTVIFTQGTDPTISTTTDATGAVKTVQTPVALIKSEDIVDTNGAGDAFAGAFCAGLVQGKPIEKSVSMGHWLSSLGIRQLGPSYPFPKQTYTE